MFRRVVSCAQLTTRPRLPRASRVVRAAHDATSRRTKQARRDSARRTSRAPSERSSPGPHPHDPPEAPCGHRSRLAPCAPLTTRGGRTHARRSRGPYARGSCHARELVTRAATLKRESGGNPRGDRRPPTEGRTERVPRNPVDEETTRLRVRLRALHRVSQGRVRFGAHASKQPTRKRSSRRPERASAASRRERPHTRVERDRTRRRQNRRGAANGRERLKPPRRAPCPAPDACHPAARPRPSSRCPAPPSSRRRARPCTPSSACCA